MSMSASSSSSVMRSSIFVPSSSSSSLALPASNSAPAALDHCITRIKQLIQKVKLGIPSGNVNLTKIICPILQDTTQDPVVTQCGHLFDRKTIEEAKKANPHLPCPDCRAPNPTFSPVFQLQALIEDWKNEEPIPTLSHFKSENPKRVALHLATAKSCIEEKDYRAALDCYSQALQYTQSSEVYAKILELYDKLGEPGKATLSRLHLSVRQIEEGKIQEAMYTLEACPSSLHPDPLVIGLLLQICRSDLTWGSTIAMAMEQASRQPTSEDKIFIYKQIITQDPYQFQAHRELIDLTTDPTEKRALLLKAADLAHQAEKYDIEKTFRQEAATLPNASVISAKEWAAASTVNLPPYPPALKEFLAGDCQIWPGKKRWETHIVAPLFPMVDIDGTPVPLTVETLDQLDKNTGGPGFEGSWYSPLRVIGKNIPSAEKEFHWAVMTNDVLPGSRDKSYKDQLPLLPAGYETPGIFDAARALLWENRRSGRPLFSSAHPWTYTRCKESIENQRLGIGNLTPDGLIVTYAYYNTEDFGLAGWRKF